MIATLLSIQKLIVSLQFFVRANAALATILNKLSTTNYKTLLRKLYLPVVLVRLITKVTVTDITAPIPNTSIIFIQKGCNNDPTIEQISGKGRLKAKTMDQSKYKVVIQK